jgi:hypothetical protein
MLSSLDQATLTGRAGAEMREQIDRASRRLAFLNGRILIRMEPQAADLIGKVEKTFDAARGLDAEQDCLIDLELGDLLLRSARQGSGDPMNLYRRSVAAFERAAGRYAPALRADTIRGLSAAYAMHDTIVRIAKSKAGTTRSQSAK